MDKFTKVCLCFFTNIILLRIKYVTTLPNSPRPSAFPSPIYQRNTVPSQYSRMYGGPASGYNSGPMGQTGGPMLNKLAAASSETDGSGTSSIRASYQGLYNTNRPSASSNAKSPSSFSNTDRTSPYSNTNRASPFSNSMSTMSTMGSMGHQQQLQQQQPRQSEHHKQQQPPQPQQQQQQQSMNQQIPSFSGGGMMRGSGGSDASSSSIPYQQSSFISRAGYTGIQVHPSVAASMRRPGVSFRQPNYPPQTAPSVASSSSSQNRASPSSPPSALPSPSSPPSPTRYG